MMACELPAGARLDSSLEIRRVLGSGTFGITYLAYDRNLQLDFVLKEFFPKWLARRVGVDVVPFENSTARDDFHHFLERFKEEARIAAKINHPNLVKVHRYFDANGTGYFQMDWHDGETLEVLLKRRQRMPALEVVGLIKPLLHGLQQLHSSGLIHRDIKPGNVYVRDDGEPLLLDFGATRVSGTPQMTEILTPRYAPPEQYSMDGSAQGPHTDVYGVGALMYRLLTGLDPKEVRERSRESEEERFRSSCRENTPSDIPSALCDVVDRAMTLNARDRIPDCQILRREMLAAVVEQQEQEAPPAIPALADSPTVVSDASNSKVVGAGVSVFVVAIAFGFAIFLWQQYGSRSTTSLDVPAADVISEPAVRPASNGGALHEKQSGMGSLSFGEEMVQKVRSAFPGRDLAVTVALDPPQSNFVEGQLVSIGFSTKEVAYAMVLVYSGNDSVTMLYPNDYAEGQAVKPNVVNWVGGDRKFVVKVVPPFGIDTVHVVAFRNADDLKSLLQTLDIRKNSREMFTVDRPSLERSISAVRSRGLAVKRQDGVGATMSSSGWGDAVVTITTRSRLN
jgi:serine/threonine protein kinase